LQGLRLSEQSEAQPQPARSTNPIDLAADVLVFAPLGFVLEARKLVPKLVARGKREVSSARVIGSFVTPMLKRNAERQVRSRIKEARAAVGSTGLLGGVEKLISTTPEQAKEPEQPHKGSPVSSDPPAVPAESVVPSAERVATVHGLPIDGYDQLPSSTIVELLDRLSPLERRAVEAYEEANRKRRTILTKVRLLDTKRA
jgi:hypothetical protein